MFTGTESLNYDDNNGTCNNSMLTMLTPGSVKFEYVNIHMTQMRFLTEKSTSGDLEYSAQVIQ